MDETTVLPGMLETAETALSSALGRLVVHDHPCLIYETQEEQFSVIIPFIRIGLERGEKCVYIADDNAAEAIIGKMQAVGIDVAAAVQSGQLEILSKNEAYLKQGYFDPDWMIDFLQRAVDEAKSYGFPALRATGEMTWVLGGGPGAERLIEYEAKLNYFLPRNDVLAICQYNRRRFPPEIIKDVISTHPLVIFEGMVCRNFYYVPPGDFLGEEQSAKAVDRLLGNLRDREKVERAVQASEDKFRAIFDHAADGILLADLEDKRFLTGNRRICKMLGYTLDELRNLGVTDIHPLESLPYVLDQFARQARGEFTMAKDIPVQRKDGSVFSADINSYPLEVGGKNCLAGEFRDVTEQKKAEQERESLLRWQEGVNLLQRSLLVAATQEQKLKSITDGIVRFFNADFCRIWLIQSGDLCERGCIHAEVLEGPHVCRHRDRCLHLLASSGRYTHTDGKAHGRVPFGCYKIGLIAAGEEHKFLTNDVQNDPRVHNHEWARDLGLVAFAGYQLRVPGGQAIGVLALFAKHPISAAEDAMLDGLSSTVAMIIQQTAAEAALKSSEKFIKDILASVKEAFVVLDRQYRILSANRAYCEMAGKPLAEIIGRPCYEMSHHATQPGQEPEYFCGYEYTFETGEPVSIVHAHTDANGKQRQVEVKTYAMKDESGGVASVIEVINDITERTLLEGQLRQAQKMEAIGTLAGGIAHDFNNILTAIIGFGEIVMEQLPSDSPLREDQAHVLKAGKRAGELVKQILTFSRRSEQKLQPLMVQFVVKEALKLLRASIPASIEIREDIDVNCGAVLADPGQIHQVVMNLCTNAFQAMRETGGVLSVALKSLVVSVEGAELTVNLHPGPYVRLEVADTGCGISRAARERIFEPYFTTKPKGEGTGLGLSLVHGIVSSLGGAISVYSEIGRGTTFKVYLPLIAGEARGEVVVKSEVPPGGNESLLVVDDEESIARFERKVLEGLGYRVTEFTDSEQALLAFRDNPGGFDLILTDMTMPRLNGDDLAREILEIRPGMPMIICTGFSELIDARKARFLGISGFLQKPIGKDELARAVRRALDGDSREGAQEAGPAGQV